MKSKPLFTDNEAPVETAVPVRFSKSPEAPPIVKVPPVPATVPVVSKGKICSYRTESPGFAPAPKPVSLYPLIGKLAVIGVWPSDAIDVVSAEAMSFSVLFAHVELMTVPVTTGLPLGNE
jgi:hypothetical protein